MRASERSVLLTTRMTGRPLPSALRSTKRVCGSGPSEASTSRTTPSTIDRPRSTSPPKSAWPGVSTMLTTTGLPFSSARWIAVFFARMVIPRSRSRSIESMTRSCVESLSVPSPLDRPRAPAWRRRASTRVVLPWSTWAMIATLRRSSRVGMRKGTSGEFGDSARCAPSSGANGRRPGDLPMVVAQRAAASARERSATANVTPAAARVTRLTASQAGRPDADGQHVGQHEGGDVERAEADAPPPSRAAAAHSAPAAQARRGEDRAAQRADRRCPARCRTRRPARRRRGRRRGTGCGRG